MGGYREKSGRSNSGYYKGIYCGSTYELCWVIYSIDHNVKFTRFPGVLQKDGLKYYPDFLLDDNKTIIETKGYEKRESVDKKSQLAESFGYIVKVLRKDDLQYAFDYVSKTYSTKKFHELYDDYKPKFTYTCTQCNNIFERDRKAKTEQIFCCRLCSGKFRKAQVKAALKNKKNNCKRLLTKEQVLEIYTRTDKSLQELANEYNISKANVWFIKKKQIYKWAHIG